MRLLFAVVVLALLGACSSLNVPTAARVQAIDYVNDDVASLLIAFDVPLTIEPVPDGSAMHFTLGGTRLTAVLVRADLDDVAGSLPPPAAERTYYLFGFSAADQAKIRTLQQDAKVIGGGPGAITVALSPQFCRSEAIDPARTRVSVLLALPGSRRFEPLLDNAVLTDALAASAQPALALCPGVTG